MENKVFQNRRLLHESGSDEAGGTQVVRMARNVPKASFLSSIISCERGLANRSPSNGKIAKNAEIPALPRFGMRPALERFSNGFAEPCGAERRLENHGELNIMQTRQLGNSDLHITPIGFGAWAIGGGGWSFAWGGQDDRDSITAIHETLDLGINWVDTASVYGLRHSHEVLHPALHTTPHHASV